MCGIFAIVAGRDAEIDSKQFLGILRDLFLLSESRGKEAAGVAFATPDRIRVLRRPVPASKLINGLDYTALAKEALEESLSALPRAELAAIGHARLVTSGLQGIDANNQPVVKNEIVCIHNGIIVNDSALWAAHPELARESEVDTEVFAALLGRHLSDTSDLASAAARVFQEIYGEASIAALFSDRDRLLLATNTGSIYYAAHVSGIVIMASELSIARRVLERMGHPLRKNFSKAMQLRAGSGLLVDLCSGKAGTVFSLTPSGRELPDKSGQITPKAAYRNIETNMGKVRARWKRLLRCSRCILPETMPFIEFDSNGVCNFCRSYKPHQLKGRESLEKVLENYRSRNGDPDCIVAFSGGRDSSYGLHLLKTELGMTPLAYTYDWGMVTDLARRNQARLCGRLGVEHIWVSADIKQKRRNIRRNVEAWLSKPELGMVPLFMAGDKQFMYHANRLMKETGIRLMVYCTNHFEKTDFKVGFCGVRPQSVEIRLNRISAARKLQLVAYYLKNYLLNPGYINASLIDTATAFFSYYFINQDFLYLFDYLPWREDEINRTLIEHYDWELAQDTNTTWRIGDGTAPFYNHIYMTVAGFSEYETFRSNQIREGLMTREEALRLTELENISRVQSIQDYCRVIGVDFDATMAVIDSIPKLY
jgi:glucosamine--fructose-6-phosphate aminotransferase (isomerizing)